GMYVAQRAEWQHDEARADQDLARLIGRDQPITASRYSLDKQGTVGIVAECRSQSFDCRVEAALEIDEGAGRPDPALQIVSRDDLSGAFEQQAQDRERLRLQPN